MSTAAAELVPCYVAGKRTSSTADRTGPVHNPSSGQVIARTPFCTAAEVDAAVRAAAAALPEWAETPAVDRARVMFRYREKLDQHAEELANLVTREHGKT